MPPRKWRYTAKRSTNASMARRRRTLRGELAEFTTPICRCLEGMPVKATGRGLARLPAWMLIIFAVSGYVVFHQLQMLLPITKGATNLAALAQVVIMTIAKYLL